MKIIQKYQFKEIATVFLGRTSLGNEIEFVESTQPPLSREEKEVLIVSTLVGCPVKCIMCDAGGFYKRKLKMVEMLEQIHYVIQNRYGDLKKIPTKKLKIQFSRMGEPSFNSDVLKLLKRLPIEVPCSGLLPSISSIAPLNRDSFFEQLLEIKNEYYSKENFQFQFSVHSTDPIQRQEVIPIHTWDLKQMGRFGERFVREKDKKITLNFVIEKKSIIDPNVIAEFFNPNKFFIKLTPLNPTYQAALNQLENGIDVENKKIISHPNLIQKLEHYGFECKVNIGEVGENGIGSNCGQYVKTFLKAKENNNFSLGYEFIE